MPHGPAARRLVLVERCALDAASLSGRPAWPSEPVAVRGPAVPFASVRVLSATVTITLTPSPQSSRPHVAACRCCSSALAGDTTARTTARLIPPSDSSTIYVYARRRSAQLQQAATAGLASVQAGTSLMLDDDEREERTRLARVGRARNRDDLVSRNALQRASDARREVGSGGRAGLPDEQPQRGARASIRSAAARCPRQVVSARTHASAPDTCTYPE